MTAEASPHDPSRTAFVLVPGAGGQAWYWHRLAPQLRARGYEALAVDLPAADESAGLEAYANVVVEAPATCLMWSSSRSPWAA